MRPRAHGVGGARRRPRRGRPAGRAGRARAPMPSTRAALVDHPAAGRPGAQPAAHARGLGRPDRPPAGPGLRHRPGPPDPRRAARLRGRLLEQHGRFTVPGAEPVPTCRSGPTHLGYACGARRHAQRRLGALGRPARPSIDLDDVRVDADSGRCRQPWPACARTRPTGSPVGSPLPTTPSWPAPPCPPPTWPVPLPAHPQLPRAFSDYARRAWRRRRPGWSRPSRSRSWCGRDARSAPRLPAVRPTPSSTQFLFPAGRVVDRHERAVRRVLRRAGPVDRPALPAGGRAAAAARTRPLR